LMFKLYNENTFWRTLNAINKFSLNNEKFTPKYLDNKIDWKIY
jgi:hypothetical protein